MAAHEKVLLVTPPAYKTYRDNINSEQWDSTRSAISGIMKISDNISYYNFMEDTDFVREDFYDADHLAGAGSKKMSLKINDLLAELLNAD